MIQIRFVPLYKTTRNLFVYFWKLRSFDGKRMWRLSAREKAAGTETLSVVGLGRETVRAREREGDFERVDGRRGAEEAEIEGEGEEVECGVGVFSAEGVGTVLRIEVI